MLYLTYGDTVVLDYYGANYITSKDVLSVLPEADTADEMLYRINDSYFILDYFPKDRYLMCTAYLAPDGILYDELHEALQKLNRAEHTVCTILKRGAPPRGAYPAADDLN